MAINVTGNVTGNVAKKRQNKKRKKEYVMPNTSKQAYMSGSANKQITQGLTQVLADTFVLYFKTHSFHWNVEGPHFHALHDLFSQQYTELWNATDEIAERIRALGEYAPNNWKNMFDQATLKESGQTPDWKGMLQQLEEDHIAIVESIFPVLRAAEDAGDEATVDMLIQRTQIHEKTAWMLKSLQK